VSTVQAARPGYAQARPVWAEIDLDAITHNLGRLRERAARPVKVIAPVKANAYGHGVTAVGLHLEGLGVDGLATANLDDALAMRAAGVGIPILMYGSQLPDGTGVLLENRLTPTVYSSAGVEALAKLAERAARPVDVHVKVDCGLGRLGLRPERAPALVREVLSFPELRLEGIYTHIPFDEAAGAAWSRRALTVFAGLVHDIEAEHGIRIDYAQASASSVLSEGFPDALNTIAPGHLMYGLSPIGGERAETLGFRKALRGLRAQLIHVGHREVGDDLLGTGPGGATEARTTGVILLGMDNGYRAARGDIPARMLVHGHLCRVLAVSAEYAVIDVTDVPGAAVGDTVTVIGEDGGTSIAVEDVAEQLGAPSAAYWMVGLRNVPYRYGGDRRH
jgi:alanine racemase